MKKWLLILGVVLIIGLVVCHREEVGWIAVNSEPQGAAVYLDDTLIEQKTNCMIADVSPDTHSIKLVLEGYHDWESLVEVEAGDTSDVYAVLTLDTLPDDTSETDRLLWRYKFDGYYYTTGGLVLGLNGTVYVSADNYLYAINPDGTLKWRYESDSSHLTVFAVGPEENIYCREGNRCFCAFSPAGNLRWTFSNTYPIGYGAIVADGTIYLIYKDTLSAFTPDGIIEWEYVGDGYPTMAIVGEDGTIYACVRNGIIALTSNGQLKWECPEVLGYPEAIDWEGTIYCYRRADKKSLYAVDVHGTLKWEYEVDCWMISTDPVIASDGTIYFGAREASNGDNYLYAISQSGEFKRRYEFNEPVTTPAIGSDGTIYVGSQDTYLYAINPDGSLKWRYEAGAPIMSHLTIGSNGAIYFCTSYHLYAVKSESGGLANSPWPKYQHDNQNTGCAGGALR